MAARLGHVLYWLGCIVAGLIALFAVIILSERKVGPNTHGTPLHLSWCLQLRRGLVDAHVATYLQGNDEG
jgi:hypothetical protein